MIDQTRPPETVSIDTNTIAAHLMKDSNVHLNVSQEVIITTEDKVRICLIEHLKKVEHKKGWIAPLGIFIAICTTLSTSTFNNIFLDAPTWRAIFLLVGVISFCWLVWSVIMAFKSEKVDDIVLELKKGSKKILETSKA